jgi:hypothetical protein
MPGNARTRLALGDQDGLWGLAEHLQADAIEAAHIANWQRANTGLKKHEQSPPPEPYDRPGRRRQQRKQVTAADLLAHRERMQARAAA